MPPGVVWLFKNTAHCDISFSKQLAFLYEESFPSEIFPDAGIYILDVNARQVIVGFSDEEGC